MSENTNYELTKNVITLLEAMHWDPVFYCSFGYESPSKTKISAMVIRLKFIEETEKFHIVGRVMKGERISDDTPYDFISEQGLTTNEIGSILYTCVENKVMIDTDPLFVSIFKDLKDKFKASLEEGNDEISEIVISDGAIKKKDVYYDLADGLLYVGADLVGTFREVQYSLSVSQYNPPFTYMSDLPTVKVDLKCDKMLIVNQDYSARLKNRGDLINVRIVITGRKNTKGKVAWNKKSIEFLDATVNCDPIKAGSPFIKFTCNNINSISVGPATKTPLDSIVEFPNFDEISENKAQGRFANVVATNSLTSFIQKEVERVGLTMGPQQVDSGKSSRFGRIVN
jgi:hypothetical protein